MSLEASSCHIVMVGAVFQEQLKHWSAARRFTTTTVLSISVADPHCGEVAYTPSSCGRLLRRARRASAAGCRHAPQGQVRSFAALSQRLGTGDREQRHSLSEPVKQGTRQLSFCIRDGVQQVIEPWAMAASLSGEVGGASLTSHDTTSYVPNCVIVRLQQSVWFLQLHLGRRRRCGVRRAASKNVGVGREGHAVWGSPK